MNHSPDCHVNTITKSLRQKLESREITVEDWIDLTQEALDMCSCRKISSQDQTNYIYTGPPTPSRMVADTYEGYKPASLVRDASDPDAHIHCRWRKVAGANGYWVDDSHGNISYFHPRGYCDQGCCQ